MRRRSTEALNSRKILDRLHEWESIRFSQKPRSMMLLFIVILNVFLLLSAAWVISAVAMPGGEHLSFFTAVYNTITMILDAGCIQALILDPGQTNLFLIIFCLVVIILSMITFTGALIGYVTNLISNLIDNANANSIQLKISDHVVILGWNNRASEIINDLLFCPSRQKVVVLAENNRNDIAAEISERLNDTIARENREIAYSIRQLPWLKRKIYMHRHKLKNNLTVIVREGDIFSSVHLNNIMLERARSIIILGGGIRDDVQCVKALEDIAEREKGDNRTVKTLMQVVDITSKATSNDDQKVVVEVENDWTGELVDKIIKAKQKLGKCRVVPFRVHKVMGQLLGQFSLMPELNIVYRELFSNKGASFYAHQQTRPNDPVKYIGDYLKNHFQAIPLTFMKDFEAGNDYCYYIAQDEHDIGIESEKTVDSCALKLNEHYWISEKHVLILGSNSKIANIMNSFQSFCDEWTNANHPEIVHITIVDEEEKLEKFGYYQQYPFVEKCVAAQIYEQSVITEAITSFITAHPQESSILILSDDTVSDRDIDAKTMTYLIYAKDIINRTRMNRRDENFNVDIVAEIIEPKHVDIIRSYDVNNVVISNRYISKLITQISEDYALYNLYVDIMSYDTKAASSFDTEEDQDRKEVYDSKEVYIKKAKEYFSVLPPKNVPASALIRSVYNASLRILGSSQDFAVLLGYVDSLDQMHLFSGPQDQQLVTITPEDKLIIFSNH